MTRQERAKQFMPFDAMKGLKEALAKRERNHSRVGKRELAEETIEQIGATIRELQCGMPVTILHYKECHEVESSGNVNAIDTIFKYILLGNEKISFDNIYEIKIQEI